MADSDSLTKAIIAAALITSGHFKLSQFDPDGQPGRFGDGWERTDEWERLLVQADRWSRSDADWRKNAALNGLRKMTDAIVRALDEPLDLPEAQAVGTAKASF